MLGKIPKKCVHWKDVLKTKDRGVESNPRWRQIPLFQTSPDNTLLIWGPSREFLDYKRLLRNLSLGLYVPMDIWTSLNEYFKHLPLLYYPVSGWKAGHNRMEMSVKREDTELKEAQQETESYSFIFHKNRSF